MSLFINSVARYLELSLFTSIIFPVLGFSFCFKKSGNLTLPIKHKP